MTHHQENKEYLQAYRLYILEKCRLKDLNINAKYFDAEELDFDPNKRQHVTEILRNMGSAGKDPARHVYNILIGKTNNFTSGPLSELAARLGLSNYSSFVDNKELLSKYTQAFNDHRMNRHEGLYFIYACSSYRKGLVRYPLLMYANGTAQLKTSGNNIVKGKTCLIHEDKYLLLDFLEYNGIGAFMGTFIFYIRDVNADFGPGISMRLNDKFKPQAKREFLSLHEAPNRNFEQSLREFNESKFEYFYPASRRYQELIKMNEGMHTLLGREYNLITQKINNTKSGNLFRREEFDRLYFNQALLEFLKEEKQTPQVSYYFELSVEHGLFIGKRYENRLQEFFKILGLSIAKRQRIKKTFDSYYKREKERYNGDKAT